MLVKTSGDYPRVRHSGEKMEAMVGWLIGISHTTVSPSQASGGEVIHGPCLEQIIPPFSMEPQTSMASVFALECRTQEIGCRPSIRWTAEKM